MKPLIRFFALGLLAGSLSGCDILYSNGYDVSYSVSSPGYSLGYPTVSITYTDSNGTNTATLNGKTWAYSYRAYGGPIAQSIRVDTLLPGTITGNVFCSVTVNNQTVGAFEGSSNFATATIMP